MIPSFNPYNSKLDELKDQIKVLQGLTPPPERYVAEDSDESDPSVGMGAATGVGAGQESGAALSSSSSVLPAGIMAGTGLAGVLMKNAADRRALQNKLMYDALGKEYDNKAKAIQATGEGERQAFSRIMQNIRGVIR